MPNNAPPITDKHSLSRKREVFKKKAVVDYSLFLGFDGVRLEPLIELAGHVVGLKLYLDETFGDMTTAEPKALAKVFEAWPGPGPIAIHSESHSIGIALDLARRYGQRVHICHVPHPDDLLRIDAARQQGVQATCEVTPHHLFLSAEVEGRLGAYAHVKPPLICAAEQKLFWERLHLVDIVASDHAPHTWIEKESVTPPPGVPGLETTLPLLLYAVETGRLTLERMVALTFHNPLDIYRLVAPKETWVEVELGKPYRLPEGGYHTRCGWSPFVGCWALGRVQRVQLRGDTAWQEGLVRKPPGYGHELERRKK